MPSISVRQLYQDNQQKMQMTWVAGTGASDNRISVEATHRALVGHLNLIHHNQVQVIGNSEIEYLNQLSQDKHFTGLDELLDFDIPLMIVANDLPVPDDLRAYCHAHNVPLLTSQLESPYLMDLLRLYLQRVLAISTTKHGVFLDVFEVGVLLTGQSGLGKSELALELISRGHSLIADDSVELLRTTPETLEGRCPPLLRDFLEVRGLGILNIRHIFGETSIQLQKQLELIINLVIADDNYMKQLDRLSTIIETENILGVDVRSVTVPVAVGRNLAVVVEAAVRNYMLQQRGKDSTKEFIERQKLLMTKEQNKSDE